MNIFLFLVINKNGLLISYINLGGLWLILLFFICFFGVHVTRLAKLGWEYQKQALKENKQPPLSQKENEQEKSEETKKAPAQEPTQEPVYYIVERKQRRPKTSYGEPKQIRFK